MFVFVAENAKFLKCVLELLVLAYYQPVDNKDNSKKCHEAPVTDRDGCIDGAEDGQVHPNPLEDAPTPDLEGADQVPTPSPKDMVWIRRKRQSTNIKFKHPFLLQIVLLAIEKKKTIPCSGHMLQVGHCHDPPINEKAQNGTYLKCAALHSLMY